MPGTGDFDIIVVQVASSVLCDLEELWMCGILKKNVFSAIIIRSTDLIRAPTPSDLGGYKFNELSNTLQLYTKGIK